MTTTFFSSSFSTILFVTVVLPEPLPPAMPMTTACMGVGVISGRFSKLHPIYPIDFGQSSRASKPTGAVQTSPFVLSCFFIYGISRLKSRKHVSGEPTVSIVVAARNEEDTIHRCLESLANLDYPDDKLEVLLVDDQ